MQTRRLKVNFGLFAEQVHQEEPQRQLLNILKKAHLISFLPKAIDWRLLLTADFAKRCQVVGAWLNEFLNTFSVALPFIHELFTTSDASLAGQASSSMIIAV